MSIAKCSFCVRFSALGILMLKIPKRAMASAWRVPHALAAITSPRLGLRRASTASSPRVLCSVAELQALGPGRALKFPLRADSQRTERELQIPVEPPVRAARKSPQALATGFVFLCEETGNPRAFVNSCPHARLELDLDDSDFFCDGFLQCKAHGAFFDPRTFVCSYTIAAIDLYVVQLVTFLCPHSDGHLPAGADGLASSSAAQDHPRED